MLFINQTETIGTIINAGTQNLTGSLVATFFVILLFLLIIAVIFQIPLEFIAIFILPFMLVIGAFYSSFMIPIIVLFIFAAIIITKNWIFN